MNTHRSYYPIALWMGVFATGFLFLWRVLETLQFQSPWYVVTSGFEEESLFAIWKWGQHLPVYTDPHQIPFSAAYFNWLFYAVYGALTAVVQTAFSLPDWALPSVARSITVCITLLGFYVNYRLFQRLNVQKWPNSVILAMASLLWMGPFVGYWAITARPDIMALCFELAAIFLFLSQYPKHQLKAVIGSALLAYCAWSSKQICIIVPLTINLFLLLQKDRLIFLFLAIWLSCIGLTFGFASDVQTKALLFQGTAIPLSFTVLLGNLIVYFKKTIPLWALAFFVFAAWIKSPKKPVNNVYLQFSLCGLIIAFALMLPASSKLGSAENYYFLPTLFLLMTIMSLISRIDDNSVWVKTGLSLLGIGMLISATSAFFLGQNKLNVQHHNLLTLKSCIEDLPPPRFVINHYGALPWQNHEGPYFVLAYNYWNDRADEKMFEKNGIGGLIQAGYFNSLILPKAIDADFDGASLAKYQKKPTACEQYAVFVKRENA